MSVDRRVDKGRLDQPLAVIECPIDLQRCDVPSERGELHLLCRTDFPFRIEHDHLDAGHAQKTVGHGTTRVTRCRDEHVYIALSLFLDKIAQKAGHEACTDILERECRPMKEFEREDAFVHLHERDGK